LSRIRSDPSCSFAPSTAILPLTSTSRTAKVGDFMTFADGVWSGDNARDTRRWEEVSRDDPTWVPVSGGHGARRWYGSITRVIRASVCRAWPHLVHRKGCLEYSRVAGGRLAARMVLSPTAALAGVVSMFPRDGREDRRAEILGVFNSRIGTLWLRALASGLNFNPGYAARVPIPVEPLPADLRRLVDEAVRLSSRLARWQPGCQDFANPGPRGRLAVEEKLVEVEARIDREIAAIMGVRLQDLDEVRLPSPVRNGRAPRRARVAIARR
jgi:hypothetical protein